MLNNKIALGVSITNKVARNNLLTLHSDVPRYHSHIVVSTALKPGQACTHVIGPNSVKPTIPSTSDFVNKQNLESLSNKIE